MSVVWTDPVSKKVLLLSGSIVMDGTFCCCGSCPCPGQPATTCLYPKGTTFGLNNPIGGVVGTVPMIFNVGTNRWLAEGTSCFDCQDTNATGPEAGWASPVTILWSLRCDVCNVDAGKCWILTGCETDYTLMGDDGVGGFGVFTLFSGTTSCPSFSIQMTSVSGFPTLPHYFCSGIPPAMSSGTFDPPLFTWYTNTTVGEASVDGVSCPTASGSFTCPPGSGCASLNRITPGAVRGVFSYRVTDPIRSIESQVLSGFASGAWSPIGNPWFLWQKSPSCTWAASYNTGCSYDSYFIPTGSGCFMHFGTGGAYLEFTCASGFDERHANLLTFQGSAGLNLRWNDGGVISDVANGGPYYAVPTCSDYHLCQCDSPIPCTIYCTIESSDCPILDGLVVTLSTSLLNNVTVGCVWQGSYNLGPPPFPFFGDRVVSISLNLTRNSIASVESATATLQLIQQPPGTGGDTSTNSIASLACNPLVARTDEFTMSPGISFCGFGAFHFILHFSE